MDDNPLPVYASIPRWCDITDMGRTATYEALGRGDLRAVKIGRRTLIDVQHGLVWIRSRPAPQINLGRRLTHER